MCQVCFYTRQSERGNAENKNNIAKQTKKKNEKKVEKRPKDLISGWLSFVYPFSGHFSFTNVCRSEKVFKIYGKKSFPSHICSKGKL